MAGTKAGAKTTKEKYGNDFFVITGRKGGKILGLKKGFAAMPHLKRVEAGRKGGRISRRGKTKK